MKFSPKQLLLVLTFLCMTLGSAPALSNNDKALARAQQMLRQLSAREAQLRQEMSTLQAEFDVYKKESEKKLAKSEKEKRKMSSSISSLRKDGKQLDFELDATRHALMQSHQEIDYLSENLHIQTENLEVCTNTNEALVGTAYDLIGLYKEKGFIDVLAKKEPVTGLAKVRVENIVQDFEDKILKYELNENPQALTPIDEAEVSAVE